MPKAISLTALAQRMAAGALRQGDVQGPPLAPGRAEAQQQVPASASSFTPARLAWAAAIKEAKLDRKRARGGGNKHNAVRTTAHGRRFDSGREADRYGELLLLERAGRITDLRCQVVFVLAPKVRIAGEARARPALRYTADFVYRLTADGSLVVEDAKGHATASYRKSKHLMATVHGISIVEV